jgi:cell wall-associated NlpC family hydrolase
MPTRDVYTRRLVCGAVVLCAIASLFLSSCSATSPRFRSGSAAQSVRDDEDESRFATSIREDENREDDRQVDVEQTRQELSRRKPPTGHYANRTPAGLDRDRLLLDVVSYLGTPYVYGGNTREGIDCSGFTLRVYEDGAEKVLPRSAREQFAVGAAVEDDDLEFGDLVFFNTTGRRPSHVGIYIEDDVFAHASVSRGVTFSSLESTYYRNRYVGARRIISDGNPAPAR